MPTRRTYLGLPRFFDGARGGILVPLEAIEGACEKREMKENRSERVRVREKKRHS